MPGTSGRAPKPGSCDSYAGHPGPCCPWAPGCGHLEPHRELGGITWLVTPGVSSSSGLHVVSQGKVALSPFILAARACPGGCQGLLNAGGSGLSEARAACAHAHSASLREGKPRHWSQSAEPRPRVCHWSPCGQAHRLLDFGLSFSSAECCGHGTRASWGPGDLEEKRNSWETCLTVKQEQKSTAGDLRNARGHTPGACPLVSSVG